MDETDAELVHSVRRGDRRAAGRLLQRYLRAGRAVALAVTGVEADAYDVCQDAFVVAIERIDDCREPAKFGKWLLQIVRNRARNLVRADSGRRLVALGHTTPAADPSPATRVERRSCGNNCSARWRRSRNSIERSCCTTWKAGSTARSPSASVFRRESFARTCTMPGGGCGV